jgi:hypothetical protein
MRKGLGVPGRITTARSANKLFLIFYSRLRGR